MNCITHRYSSSLHLFTLHNHRHDNKAESPFKFCYSTKRCCNIISKVSVLPLNVEDFPTTLAVAVAKPANTDVLLKTGALMICFYVVANFVVPQYIMKNFKFNKEDENENLNSLESENEKVKRSSTSKRGFNSTNPK